ncbi:MAG: hypothetical protein AVDCRST_MAG93-7614, partial [uncultured Chloroflexia bacterium]
RHLRNIVIIQADVLAMPSRQCFDYAFSIGVLHHTSSPRGAFDSVVATLKEGGAVSAWVYGRENNGWIIYLLNPLRRHQTSRLPRGILGILAYAIAAPMFLILYCIYRPVGRFPQLAWLRRYLFYFDYLFFLTKIKFHEQALIIFDHLVPSIAEYIHRDDFARWFEENALEGIVLTSRAGNSWCGFGLRSASTQKHTD